MKNMASNIKLLSIAVPLVSFLACGGASGDLDSDSVLNINDNCPNIANTDQADMDGDGIGDLCDDDADGDGVLAADDCNDNDASVLPGVENDLPDSQGIDANCDGLDGVASKAIWVSPNGDDANGDGSIESPYKTITKAVSQAESDPTKDVYLVKGEYTLSGSLNLNGVRVFGGYSELDEGTRSRNLNENTTTIKGTATFGGLVNCRKSVTDHECHLSGLKLIGGKDYPGLLIADSSPTVEDNVLETPSHAGDYAYGLLVYATESGSTRPTIKNNSITVGNASGPDGVSIGIFLANSHASAELNASIENNEIKSSKATVASMGIHAYATDPSAVVKATIKENKITVGSGRYSLGIGFGMDYSSQVMEFDYYFTQATIEKNTIWGEQSESSIDTVPVYLTDKAGNATGLIRNNLMQSSLADSMSAGLALQGVQVDFLNNTVLLNSKINFIGVSLADMSNSVDTKLRAVNNILAIQGNSNSNQKVGFYITGNRSSITEMKNNLISADYDYQFFESSNSNTQDADALNALSFASDNLVAAPEFANEAESNFQLSSENSPGAKDALSIEDLKDDINGKTRDTDSPTIGAYEM